MTSSPVLIVKGALKLLFAFITEPSTTITSPQARRDARLAASLFALTVVFAIIHVTLFSVNNRRAPWVEVVLIGVMISLQYLCRTRWSKIAILAGLYLTFAIAPFLMFLQPAMDGLSLQLLLSYPIIGILLTYILFKARAALVVGVVTIIGMWFSVYSSGMNAPSNAILTGYVIQSLTIAGTLIFVHHYETAVSRALLQSNADGDRVRRIIDNVADIVLMTDANLVIQYVNRAATAVLQYEAVEFEGRSLHTVFEIMHPDDKDAIVRALQRVISARMSIRTEYRLRRKDGEYVWIESISNFLLDASGSVEGIIFNGRDISERKAADTAHARDQARYETLVNSITGIVWLSTTHGEVNFVSRQVKDILGFEPEQMVGKARAALERVHPEDRDRVVAIKRAMTAKREDHRIEYRMIDAHGQTLWVRDTVRYLVDDAEGDQVLGLLVNVTDLKEAQAAEQQQRQFADALRVSAAQMTETVEQDEVLDHILRQARDMFAADCMNIVLMEDFDVRIVRAFGYEQFGIQPKTDTQEIALPDYENLRQDVVAANGRRMRRLQSHLSAPIRVNGEVIAVINLDKIAPHAFDEQTRENLQAFADQSSVALRNAQLYLQVKRYAEELEFLVAERTEALLKERRQLQTILSAMTEGVAYTEGTLLPNDPLTTVYVNPALQKMTGYSAAELMRTNLNVLLEEGTREEQAAQNRHDARVALMENRTWRTEMQLFRSDGRVLDVGLTSSRVDDSAGNLLGLVTVVRDISEEKALATHRERFIAHASHELRTPVTNLITRLYLIRKRPSPIEPHIDLLDEIAQRMKLLVDDLLDVSRMDRHLVTLKRQPLPISALLQSVVRLQQGEADKKHIHLQFEPDGVPTELNVDADRLTQVITNLISNAINYTSEQGTVTVRLETLAEERKVSIAVADTGIGIPPEHLDQIFAPFFRVPNETVSVKGSGLGLAISKEIVEMHGGTLTVESESGRGSRFIVCLPM